MCRKFDSCQSNFISYSVHSSSGSTFHPYSLVVAIGGHNGAGRTVFFILTGIEGGGVANYENIKDYGFDKRTAKEQREIAVMGGKASGEARRRKADFRKTLNMLLTAEIDNEEYKPVLEALGIECTLESALNMAMIKEGLAGNVKAYEAIAKYAGQSNQTERDDEEQRIRTERAKRARDLEVGNDDSNDENIQNFLKAMRPTQEDLEELFDNVGDGENEGEEKTE
jgi:hypothetical protein